MQFKLSAQVYDVFGRTIDDHEIHDLFSTTDMDIERQFRAAEMKLGNEGVGNKYVNAHYDEEEMLDLKIQVILYAACEDCMRELQEYARDKFHTLNNTYRRQAARLEERFKKRYDEIVSDGDKVSKHSFRLPDMIRFRPDAQGKRYRDHLFVDADGIAEIDLNSWEQKVIEEEEQKDDFVCWLRNRTGGPWTLCIPYDGDGEKKATYPDFLIIRRDWADYSVDVLEPHDPTRQDNLGKAKGFAEHAKNNPGVARIQLIRMKRDPLGRERPYRLDMAKSAVRERVLRCTSNEELAHVFDEEGFFDPIR